MMRLPSENFRSPTGLLRFFGVTVAGLIVDLWSKSLAVALDNPRRSVEVIPRWLEFTYTENHGAVFGIGQGQRVLFIAVSILAIGFLTYLFAISVGRRFYQFLLGMLLAGVLGNMYDRIRYGYVRDMIHALPGFYWPDWIASRLPAEWANGGIFPWVFNVADTLLCMGVFSIVVYSLIYPAPPPLELEGQPQTNPRQ